MADSIISFDDFELPFMEDPGEDCDELDRLEAMEDMIPSNATKLGSINSEVENWTTWRIEDHYFLIPLAQGDFNWALIRISWDDNWGRYEWRGDARATSSACKREIAKYMLESLFEHWSIDMADPENKAYSALSSAL